MSKPRFTVDAYGHARLVDGTSEASETGWTNRDAVDARRAKLARQTGGVIAKLPEKQASAAQSNGLPSEPDMTLED